MSCLSQMSHMNAILRLLDTPRTHTNAGNKTRKQEEEDTGPCSVLFETRDRRYLN